ncbi:alpha/beta fold hydrolase [Microvirga sp. BT350]|uniref:Alpha/beta fold hydrolase n=2 Tax=Microvirga alba TaxID=2791025 RepID=A0A931BSN2_9HYPH|nr:alpha/beta fold hydrolase [Microvirga alba]
MIRDRSLLFEGGEMGVLLIHGLGGTPTEMKSTGRRLSETGATVLCCQLAGHCGTEADLASTRWTDWYVSAEAALSQLEARCSTIIVGGLSMGAVLAARLAAQHSQSVHGLVMLAPTLWYDGWSTPWYRFLLQLFIQTPIGRRWRFMEQEPYGIKDERTRTIIANAMFGDDSSEAGLPATPGSSVLELSRLIKTVKKDLHRIRQRTLIVHAREDDMADLSNAFYLQRHLGGLVEALVLDDSYHLVTIDRQRKLVTERCAGFVETFIGDDARRQDYQMGRRYVA